MNQCCDIKSLCIDPANPVQNFSAEAPDQIDFIGINTGWDNVNPPIGGTWDSSLCQVTCISHTSQADADQCAANGWLTCVTNTWENPPGRHVQTFLNDAENCVSFCPDGSPFNFTIPAGTILALNRALADEIAGSFACQNATLRKICLGSLTPTESCAGSSYHGTITASGGLAFPFYTWSLIAGSLPPGLSFPGTAGRTLTLSGTPTTGGSYQFTIRVTAPNGDFMQKQYSLCVVAISPDTMPDATIGTAYTGQVAATGCANQNQSWQVVAGALPPGLSLNESTGVISGTPTGPAAGYLFTVLFQDSST